MGNRAGAIPAVATNNISSMTAQERWAQMIENGKKTTVAKVLAQEEGEFFGGPERAGLPICQKCNAQMVIGLALNGREQDPNIRVEYRFNDNKDLKFERCKKCPKCGFSEIL